MDIDNVATEVADDDFDLSAALTAEFDKAEASEAPEPVETAEQAAERVRDEKGRFAAKTEEEKPEPATVCESSSCRAGRSPEVVASHAF
jgi:hypothetical protein